MQSIGLSIVHLLWLEILDQIELGQQTDLVGDQAGHDDDLDAYQQRRQQREAMIARYLRLVGAKTKASSFLARLHELRQKWGEGSKKVREAKTLVK